MQSRPVQPTDPRWKPKRTIVVLALVVQCVLVGSAILYSTLTPPAVPATPPRLVPEIVSPEDAVFPDSDLSARQGKQLPSIDVKQAAVGDAKQLQDGARLFSANCASCHGTGGRGDGPASKTLQPPPRNLTQLTGWKNPTRLSDIFRTLTLGLAGTAMPAFEYLTHPERFALAHFVVSLAPGHPPDTDLTLAALDKEFSLSEGAKESNVIPLAAAMEKMLTAEGSDTAGLDRVKAGDPIGQAILDKVVMPGGGDRLQRLLSQDRSWRDNVARLRELASVDPVAVGFRPRVRLLADAEWQTLHEYLKNRYRAANP